MKEKLLLLRELILLILMAKTVSFPHRSLRLDTSNTKDKEKYFAQYFLSSTQREVLRLVLYLKVALYGKQPSFFHDKSRVTFLASSVPRFLLRAVQDGCV